MFFAKTKMAQKSEQRFSLVENTSYREDDWNLDRDYDWNSISNCKFPRIRRGIGRILLPFLVKKKDNSSTGLKNSEGSRERTKY